MNAAKEKKLEHAHHRLDEMIMPEPPRPVTLELALSTEDDELIEVTPRPYGSKRALGATERRKLARAPGRQPKSEARSTTT